MDAIDEVLDCIRLQWQRVPSEHNRFLAGSEFGLIPVECIREVVHVVPRDCFMSQTTACSQRKKSWKIFDEHASAERVKREGFCVDRFYSPSSEPTTFVNDE